MIGKTISHYKILEKLGEGGMGVVYKAEDTKLRRTVALKLLTPELARDAEAKKRFLHEAQAASALDHPSICTVFEADEDGGAAFIAMAFLDGQSLKEKVGSGPMKLEEAIDIAIQIAEGLQEAHEKGVIHRDIKPANIMLTLKAKTKILDFGLAKVTGQTALTKAGTTLGTVAYMSPEQAGGEDVDHRSDIWSLGALLYEMVTGQLPFRGDYEPAIVYSILNSVQEPITALRAGVPMKLERIVTKTLAKSPEERYQHADELLVDLRSVAETLRSGKSGVAQQVAIRPHRRRPYLFAGIATVLAVLAISWIDRFTGPSETMDSIAVLPLENLSNDPEQEYFADGMTEALIADLAKIGALKVISRTSVMRYKGTNKPLPDIAAELNVAAVIEGSILRVGDRVRITAQLIEGRTDKHLWAESYERDLSDILTLQGEVAQAIAQGIKIKLTPQEKEQLQRATSVSPEAHDDYLLGRYYWNKRTESGLEKSIEYYQSALDKDPGYAMACAGQAQTYIVLGDWGFLPPMEAYPKARIFAARALEIDDELAEAHTALASIDNIFDWNFAEAENRFERAIELKPGDATAHQWYAEHLTMMGRPEEALLEINRALELDPLSLIVNVVKGWILFHAGRLDESLVKYQEVLEVDPEFGPAHSHLVMIYLTQEMYDEAVDSLVRTASGRGISSERLEELVDVYRTSGIKALYRWQIEMWNESAEDLYVSPSLYAWNYAALGEKDKAFEYLEKAYEARSGTMALLRIDRRLDSLRSDPRFDILMKKVGFEE